jgi:hypothetical protein
LPPSGGYGVPPEVPPPELLVPPEEPLVPPEVVPDVPEEPLLVAPVLSPPLLASGV